MDTITLAYFTISMLSVCSMPAKGEKPKSWPNLPMRSRLMVPVPRTSVRSVWIGQQATKLACVSISAQSAAQAEPFLDRWFSWARRCRLEPIKAVAKTLKNHWPGFLNAFDARLTNGRVGAVNSII